MVATMPGHTTRDPDETRVRLLTAARTEFAEHGLGGARVERIASAAGVSKERIYGHFGSKEQLFIAVVAEALYEHAVKVGMPEGDPGVYAGRVFDFHRTNPQLTRLLMWEALYTGSQPIIDEKARSAHYAAKVAALSKATGARMDEHTATLMLTIIGIAVWPLAFPQMTKLIVGDVEEHADHIRQQVTTMAARLCGT
jgi:AcrR family transcriptional regulator